MFPYIEHPVLDLGFWRIEAFPVLVLLAVVVELTLVTRRAPKAGFDPEEASRLIVWAVAIGLVGAHVFDAIAYFPERVRRDPWELLRVWGSLSSTGGMLFGLSGVALVMWRKGFDRRRVAAFADLCLYALPFTLAVGRLGCALQHDHLGIRSDHWLAVRFPSGPRFDLGLLESLFTALLALAFLALDRRPRPVGFFGLLFFATYGPARIAMDTLRIDDARYAGLTPAQYLCGAATLAAWLGLAWMWQQQRRGQRTPEGG